MKLLIHLMLSSLLAGTLTAENVYNLSVTSIEGQQHSLSEYQGKKILVAILPATQTSEDTAFLRRIDSVALVHTDQLQIIAVVSYEDGYNDSLLTALQPFYRSLLDTQIVITQGMYTHKTSDTLQSPLFNWLTHKEQNIHFDDDVRGAGMMFFIGMEGELNGVFGAEADYSDRVLSRMLSQ